jgi:3-oxoacyl-[acyl-carrier-protein] synthase-3
LPLDSAIDRLSASGFDGAHTTGAIAPIAESAARSVLADARIDPCEVDALLWVSALPHGHIRPSEGAGDSGILESFCYQGSWMQDALGLDHAVVSGVAQQGCAGMFAALRQARALLIAEPALRNVLCVGADAFPAGAKREVLYNVISDAACAVIVSRERLLYRWLGAHQISKGYYWDVPNKKSEIIAAYFPTAALAIKGALHQSGLQPDDVDWVIPTGVNASSWPILLRLCGISEDRLYQPMRRFGHTVAADSFIMLEEARARGALREGQKLLLFAYGFGSSWSVLILEATAHI